MKFGEPYAGDSATNKGADVPEWTDRHRKTEESAPQVDEHCGSWGGVDDFSDVIQDCEGAPEHREPCVRVGTELPMPRE